ncbi:hypothetical protein AB0J57_16370 [Streptomyces sp. NPDC049837]|uniref:hypothetical protein n=1 Tax=Streptomyces sp. NPDC049837 TaxID=3155277 RepID=UPI003442F875
MLAEGFAALAAAFGAAVVQAVGTDAWAVFRDRAARVVGAGNGEAARVELERLDRTAAALDGADGAELDRVRLRQEGAWQDHVERVLEALPDSERADAVAQLRTLIEEQERRARAEGGGLSGNTFHGPAAVQTGMHNRQTNYFGREA